MPELYERLLIMSNGADFGSNRQGEHGLTRSPSSGGAATDPDPCHSHPARGSPACRERGRTLVREAPLRAIGTRKVPRRAADRIFGTADCDPLLLKDAPQRGAHCSPTLM